jgi:hypothetical protein
MKAAVVLMAYGSPERSTDVPCLLLRHPRRPADRARATRLTWSIATAASGSRSTTR